MDQKVSGTSTLTKLPDAIQTATRINDAGVIVGKSGDCAAIIESGSSHLIPLPQGFVSASPLGISNSGVVLLSLRKSNTFFPDESYLWSNGKLQQLAPLRHTASAMAVQLSKEGLPVGGCVDSSLKSVACFWRNLAPIRLETPAGANSFANSISGHTVVGWVGPVGKQRACSWEDGRVRVFGPLNSAATGINRKGEIVGFFYRDGLSRPFLFRNGKFVELPGPTRADIAPTSINDEGCIVGYVIASSVKSAGYWISVTASHMTVLAKEDDKVFTRLSDINENGVAVGEGTESGQAIAYKVVLRAK